MLKSRATLLASAFLLFAVFHSVRAADTSPSIKVTLDLHDTYRTYPGKLTPPTLNAEGGSFYVVLENISKDPIWLVAIDDIWFDNLTIEIIDAAGKTTSCDVAEYADSPHGLTFRLLRPKETTVVKIQYVDWGAGGGGRPEGTYCFPFPALGGSSQVSIRAIFDKTPYGGYADTTKPGIGIKWTGKAESEPLLVTLKGRNKAQ